MPPRNRRRRRRERRKRDPSNFGTSYDDIIEKMTPEQCKDSFEDMLGIIIGYSFLEIVDNMLVFFTIGIWKRFSNMRQSYAHASLGFIEESITFLNCYIPNEEVYNT